MTEKLLLGLILIAFLALGIVYTLNTPVFEASDELWHYPMIQHLANGNPLPEQVFDPQAAGPWKQEASQPPLYYYLGAALTFWIDTTDMGSVRWLNPHVDNGVITLDGNTNLIIHNQEDSPWQGTLLAVRIIRLFSVLLGATTVLLTYHIARLSVPGRPEIALASAGVTAFTPMFIFISAAVNNDNLIILLASLSILLMIRIMKDEDQNSRVTYIKLILLGVIIGLGTLSKITAIGLLPLALGTLWLNSWQSLPNESKSKPVFLFRTSFSSGYRFLLVLIPVILVAGWWFYRNLVLYGDWSGWNAFIAVLGQRAHPASLAQLWDERWGFMLSYWGLFGGLNVSMPDWIYRVLNSIVIVSVLGFLLYFWTLVKRFTGSEGWRRRNFWELVSDGLSFTVHNFGLILCLIWSAAVVVGLIRWANITWSSQGRLVFSAISALSTLLVIGLAGWLPQRISSIVLTVFVSFMLVIAILAPVLWISPAYEPPEKLIASAYKEVNADFDQRLRLLGYEVNSTLIQPGDTVEVMLAWETLSEMDRDWSVFVHLQDPVLERPVAQRDMFLGQGLLSTQLLTPGQQVLNRYHLQVPETAIAPVELSLKVGLYDYLSGERLVLEDGEDSLTLASLNLEPIKGAVTNPLNINFENELNLVGFNIEPRKLGRSDMADLTLFWRPLRKLETDYTFFAQVVDSDTTRWASQDLQQPTRSWTAGDLEVLELQLQMSEETPAGLYPIIVGVYTRTEEGAFDRLQTVTSEGRLTDDFLALTHIRIE
jgi:hypothetical protein